ncbi:MAG: hypothetical protein IJW18_08335 [Lachnospiraceae bacterium]|nr:hypothetical protein [Lachnospiraceae bacterium]
MDKETEILQQYIEDIQNIPKEEPGEKLRLIEELLNGKSTVKTRLSELCLMQAMQVATEFRGQGLPLVDLIQESNIAVMMFLEDFEGDAGEFDTKLTDYVKASIKAAVNTENVARREEEKLAEKINELSDTTQMLAERLGREATLEELNEYTKLTEDEIKTLMKMSLDAL